MTIRNDWHIHSHNSCDGACIELPELLRGTAEKGILDFGLTDHVHTPFNLPDIAASRREFDACAPNPRFHFGVEASCVSQWEIDEVAAGRCPDPTYGVRVGGPAGAPLALGITAEDIEVYGVEYVIGGTHWPMYVPWERQAVIRDFQRQNMFLATHPLVDIVAHPWWWHGHWADEQGRYTTGPWLDGFAIVPQSMHDDFAAAAVEHGTAVEIGITAILLNRSYPESFRQQYLDYLAGLKQAGVRLSIGSDCHAARYDTDFRAAEQLLDSVGIDDDDLWRLRPRSAAGGSCP